MNPQQLGEMWHDCDRCGESLPMSRLKKNPQGNLICGKCWDTNEGEIAMPNKGTQSYLKSHDGFVLINRPGQIIP